jgi:hypothetical protein
MLVVVFSILDVTLFNVLTMERSAKRDSGLLDENTAKMYSSSVPITLGLI